jgi:small conductance mechanosensitive channel
MKTRYLLIILFLSLGLGTVASSAEQDAAKATTTADPDIPGDELELLLRPLTRTELEAETQGWLELLKTKISEISESEIGAKYKRTELQSADDLQAAIDEIEQAKQAADDNPDDTAAAEALAAAISTAKALEKESKTAAKEMDRNAAVNRVIEAAAQYAEELAADNEDDDTVVTPEPNSKPSAEQDAGDRKLAKVRAVVTKKAAERALAREQLLEYINHLRAQQTSLTDNTNIVITAWEVKGGDVTEAHQYISAVSGIRVDITDAEATWKTLSGWTMSEEGGLRWAKNISVFIITIIVFIFLSRLAVRGTRKLFAKAANTSQLLEDFTLVTVRRLVIAIGFLVALTTLEINVGPLLAVIGAAGFVVAFALQDSLGNFASGILV